MDFGAQLNDKEMPLPAEVDEMESFINGLSEEQAQVFLKLFEDYLP